MDKKTIISVTNLSSATNLGSPFGRRQFLKIAGGAGLVSFASLHGLTTQAQAVTLSGIGGSGPVPPLPPVIYLTEYAADFGILVSAPAGTTTTYLVSGSTIYVNGDSIILTLRGYNTGKCRDSDGGHNYLMKCSTEFEGLTDSNERNAVSGVDPAWGMPWI